MLGPHRNPNPDHGKWLDKRRKELEFEGTEPYVVVVGGGHSGLDIAARLKYLDISVLVLEKEPRLGDQWRSRYEALCLHDPVCQCFLFLVRTAVLF
jgi:heterodisulfide reductase subunit A-like polyferredoxin